MDTYVMCLLYDEYTVGTINDVHILSGSIDRYRNDGLRFQKKKKKTRDQ
jgi:hypothetical protein